MIRSTSRLLLRQRQGNTLLTKSKNFRPRQLERDVGVFTNRLLSSSKEMVPSDPNKNLPSTRLIDFQIASKIEGEESHVAMVELRPNEILRAEAGAMLFMTEGVVMDTKMNGASSAFNRFLTGQNLFLTDFYYEGNTSGTVALGTDFPSKILRFSLEDCPGSSLICQRGAYLASNPSVNIEMEFTKSLKAGFFGGQGFVLQKLSGEGDVLIKGGGTIKKLELAEGESVRVSSGSIVAFESTVQFDVTMMPGIKNVMFGGEGLFVTTLTGPGKVYLQGMPPERMIAEIARRVPQGMGFGIPIGLGGGGGGGEGAAGEAGADGAAEGAEETASVGGEEMVAASDAAIEADRNATVATSGMMGDNATDADSPSALFGDAAPEGVSTKPLGDDDMTASTTSMSDDASFSSNESTYMDDGDFSSTTNNEFSLDDSNFASADDFSSEGDGTKDGELFNDDGSGINGDSLSDSAEEGGSSILSTLWDIFTGND